MDIKIDVIKNNNETTLQTIDIILNFLTDLKNFNEYFVPKNKPKEKKTHPRMSKINDIFIFFFYKDKKLFY
jgi:hypothetical protein